MIGLYLQQFYIDPASGYVFRSKKDALRYLNSGDISSCALKPYKRQIQDEDKITVRLVFLIWITVLQW